MSQKKKKIYYLTIHASKPLIARFKKIFGRWKEYQIELDENAKPTQKDFMGKMLDFIAEVLGVDM